MAAGSGLLRLSCVLLMVLAYGCAAKAKFSDLSDRELYDVAVQRMEKEDFYQARVVLERLLQRGNIDPDVVPMAQLAMADAYYGKRGLLNLAEAMSRYSNYLTFYPTHEKADYAQYRLGLCHFQQVDAPDRDQKETRVALEEFRKVEALYPNSPYVDLATEKINECNELLAEHEYRVGYFYYRRNAYLGAIDRFLWIVDKFPRYSRKDRLYYYLGDALLRTDRFEEGDVYLRKLLESYPDSEFAEKATFLLEQAQGGA